MGKKVFDCESNKNVILEMSLTRNDSTLISEIRIKGINHKNDRDIIINSLSVTPVFTYKARWKNKILIIKPDMVLDELTRYELITGDNIKINKQSFFFITGPYSYYCNDIIRPKHWQTHKNYRFDANGIPEVYYNIDIGWQKNFSTIGQYALACFDDYMKNKNEENKKIFFNQVDYLCSNYDEINGMIAYPYKFPFNNLPSGWYSGLAQGHVLSILVRAFVLANDNYYLDIAKKVADFMFVPVEGGGICLYS